MAALTAREPGDQRGERATRAVVLLTLVTMTVEIAGGFVFGSMALLADGWHMGSHAAALTITLFTYWYARRHAESPHFTFGTGKVGSLGAFASGVALGIVALLMMWESARRTLHARPISFDEALYVAVGGLVVNLLSAWLLRATPAQTSHGHGDALGDVHGHTAAGTDQNLHAAYLHVLADALTSLLAIGALLLGKLFHWVLLDPLMGMVGSIIILKWTVGLLRDSARVLLDEDPSPASTSQMRDALERAGFRLRDLHAWSLAPGTKAVILVLEADHAVDPRAVREALDGFEISHLTVEVHPPR